MKASRTASGTYLGTRRSSGENLNRRTTIAGNRSSIVNKPRNAIMRSRTSPPTITNKTNNSSSVEQWRQPSSIGSNIQVYVRCRSRNQREIDEKSSVVISTMGPKGKDVIFSTSSSPLSYQKKTYSFDQVFGAESDQEMVFDTTAKNYIEEMLHGYNCTIFAYGQTGTGKTYTMSGDLNILGDVNSKDKILLGEHAGIIPRVLVDLFQRLDKETGEYSVKISFLELYNERLTDLLSTGDGTEESIRIFDNNNGNYHNTNNHHHNNNTANKYHLGNRNKSNVNNSKQPTSNPNSDHSPMKNRGKQHSTSTVTGFGNNQSSIMVKGMDEIYIKSAYEGLQLLTEGSLKRKVASTKCNDLSSRSHTIFTITTHMTKIDPSSGEQFIKIGKLNLVDLAGSENINRSGAENKRAQEAGLINKSLLTLGRVINALVDHSQHIPYRESKLTRLLQDSLGGRTKTCIIATVSPAKISMEETISTLEYATRAKSIKNTPQINQSLSKDTSLSTYINEIEKLRHDLRATRQKDGIYITQDQYDLYESNNILIDEQKTRIHNMEEQLQRFKEKYVEQTEINKELETKCKNIEIANDTLLQDKNLLISLIDEYINNWGNVSDDIKRIHENNTHLLDDIRAERDGLYSEYNANVDKQKTMIQNVLTQIDSLSKLQNDIDAYKPRFEEVLNGVNGELQSKTLSFQKQSSDIISSFNIENIITSVHSLETSLRKSLTQLNQPNDQLFESIKSSHHVIVQNTLQNVSTNIKQLETEVKKSLSSLSSLTTKNQETFNVLLNKQQEKDTDLINDKIQYIQKLERDLQKERSESITLQNYIQSLKDYIFNNIHKQRTNMFQSLSQMVKNIENKQIELDNNIFGHSTSLLHKFHEDVDLSTQKSFNDITIGSIECLEAVQAVNLTHNSALSREMKYQQEHYKKMIDTVPVNKQISQLINKLQDLCSEKASSNFLITLNNTNDVISNRINEANEELTNSIKITVKDIIDSNKINQNEMNKLSQSIENICDYILSSCNSNLTQISTTQNGILMKYYQELQDIINEVTSIANSNNNDVHKNNDVDLEDRIIRTLPVFKQPNNFKIYQDMKKSKESVNLYEDNLTDNVSPVRFFESKYTPSTPMPIPDQPLPKVLVPKSINSTSKGAYVLPTVLKVKETDNTGENNLKRRFTLESTELHNSDQENVKKVHT